VGPRHRGHWGALWGAVGLAGGAGNRVRARFEEPRAEARGTRVGTRVSDLLTCVCESGQGLPWEQSPEYEVQKLLECGGLLRAG